MWVFLAILSSLTAALVAIFGKLGLKHIDTTLATTIRSLVMAVFLLSTSLILGKWHSFNSQHLSTKDWLLIILSGVAGALSWLFYFLALKKGAAAGVAAIDRLSVIWVVMLAALFLGEKFGWRGALGSILMVLGAVLISWR